MECNMAKILIALPYRDTFFLKEYGYAVRDLQMLYCLARARYFDKIVIINRPTSVYERILGRRKQYEIIENTDNIITNSYDLLGPLNGRNWTCSCYNELLKKELQCYKDKDNSTNSSILINPSTPNSTSTSKNFNISNQYKRKSKRTLSDHNQTNNARLGQSPNILNKNTHKINNSKIKIIKAVKKKISHSNSNAKSNNNITMKNIDIVDNIDEEYIKSTSPRENLSFNSNANNHEDSINDLSQIEKLLVEIKEHFNKENSNKSKSEQRIISIDLDEKENLKKGNNEDTPHFKKRISISDYLNGGSA